MKGMIYCRVSTEGQQERGSSLESQRRACLLKAEELGYEVKPEHILLETWTGANLERPLLSRARELVQLKLVDALVCYSTDRLCRNPIHIAIIAEECEKRGVKLIFVSEPLDNSPEGQLIQYVKGFSAQLEREKIRERSLRGKREWCRRGKLATGGAPPYGYRSENGKRVIFELEASVVRTVYQWLAREGYTLYRCASELNKTLVTKRNGSKWCNTDIYRIVTNPTYKGKTYAFRYQAVEPKQPKKEIRRYAKTRHILRPEQDWIEIPDATPAIIEPETWERTQAQLRLNSQKSKRNRKREYLLSGRFRCGLCGHAMVGTTKKKGGKEYGFYRCICKVNPGLYGKCPSHIISQGKAEAIVTKKAVAIISNPDLLLAELKEQASGSSLSSWEAEQILLKSHLAQRKEEQGRYVSLYGRGNIQMDVLNSKMTKIAKEIDEIQAKLMELETKKKEIRKAKGKLDNVTGLLCNLSRKLNDPSLITLALEALDINVVLEADGTMRICGLLPVGESNQLVCTKS